MVDKNIENKKDNQTVTTDTTYTDIQTAPVVPAQNTVNYDNNNADINYNPVNNTGYTNSYYGNAYNHEIKAWLTDMDGVLVHEEKPLPGAAEFIEALKQSNTPFMVLTNNPIFTPRDLSWRLHNSGIEIPEQNIWTSALATAEFVSSQIPHGTAYVVGESGLTTALYEAGYTLTDKNPDYVIIGETRNWNWDYLTKALQLIQNGAKFICTNPDYTGPSSNGDLLAAGAIAAMIYKASGFEPYFIGKPNAIFFRTAMNKLNAHSTTTAMIGDRMDTDVRAGLEAGVNTFLVMSGISDIETIKKYPYRPSYVVNGVSDLINVAKTGNVKDITRQDSYNVA